MKNIIILLITVVSFAACKNESADTNTASDNTLNAETKAYNEQPTKERAKGVLSEISKQLKENRDDKAKVKELAEQGLELSKSNNLTGSEISYLLLLNKQYPNDPNAKNRLLDLANIMNLINKKQAANVLYSGVIDRFPDTDAAEEANAKRAPEANDVTAYLTKVGEEVFVDPDKYGVNRKAAQSYVDACEAYALAYPGTALAPEYLYKATEVSRTLRTFSKSLSMYDWILEQYPNYDKAPTAMFLKGFIIENEFHNDEKAKEVYTEFLEKYPSNQLTDDVQFLLENVGKTDEEIMEMIEKNKKPS